MTVYRSRSCSVRPRTNTKVVKNKTRYENGVKAKVKVEKGLGKNSEMASYQTLEGCKPSLPAPAAYFQGTGA